MKRLLLFFILVFVVIGTIWSVLPQPWKQHFSANLAVSSFMANEDANKQFKAQDYSQALSKWGEALAKSQNRPDLQYNLSLGLQLLGRSEEANKSYLSVIKDPHSNDGLKFLSFFNRGTMAQAEKKIDQALIEYQAALDLNPDSVETKTNIEMLIQNGGGKGKGEGQGQPKDDQDKDGKGDKDKKDENKPKEYKPNEKPKPKPFKSEQLDQSDVNKILGEIRQQEQKIRTEYNKRDVKEQPRDKDW